jgi:hypothetical protein
VMQVLEKAPPPQEYAELCIHIECLLTEIVFVCFLFRCEAKILVDPKTGNTWAKGSGDAGWFLSTLNCLQN